MNLLDNSDILASIGEFLAEDIGRGDITTQATVPPDIRGIGRFLAKEDLGGLRTGCGGSSFPHLDPETPEIEDNNEEANWWKRAKFLRP